MSQKEAQAMLYYSGDFTPAEVRARCLEEGLVINVPDEMIIKIPESLTSKPLGQGQLSIGGPPPWYVN